MKKVLLLIALAFAALTGLRAQEIQIGTLESQTYFLPHEHRALYSVSQQIYTADEIGMACRITDLQFCRRSGTGNERNIKVFMKHTSKESFNNDVDWIALSESDLVYEGNYTAGTETWPSITLDTPFEYNGTDNLLVCFWDASTSTATYRYRAYRSYNRCRSLYASNSDTEYNPYNLTENTGTRVLNINVVRFSIELNGANLSVTPNPIDLGNRPIGAWMAPKTVNLTNNGSNATLTNMSFTSNAFTVGGIELPTDLNWSQSTTFNVSLNADEAGSYEAQLAIAYQERGVTLVPVSGTAYTPVCPDVWELAQPVSSFPFTDTPTNLYDNYALPGTAEDGPDAVYALNFANDVLLNAGVTSGENGKAALYVADFNGEGGPMANNNFIAPLGSRDATPNYQISNLVVPAGDYYLAASSTTEGFSVEINTQAIPLPVAATNPTPSDGQTNVNPNNLTLRWNLGEYTTEYQLLIGLSYFPNQVLVDWTSDLAQSFTLPEALLNNRNYFWRVNERNSSGTTMGTIWGFTTSLVAPTGLVAAETKIYEGENAELSWNPVSDGSVQGYNIYQMAGNSWNWNNAVKINDAPIVGTEYTVSGLAYSMVGYKFCVRAAYDVGESGNSNQVIVYVSGTGTISGHVYEQDEATPIANARVKVFGEDEHRRLREYAFVTDSEGAYGGTIYVGTNYTAKALKVGYEENTHDGSVQIQYNTNTPDVDIYLTETYYQVGSVMAEYYPDASNPESPYVKVTWSWEGSHPSPHSGWLTYSNDYHATNVGNHGNFFQFGYKWPAPYLREYSGFNLTKVAMYSDSEGWTGGNYQCTIYSGETAPITPLSTITVNVQNGQGAYQEFDLTDAVEITGDETLWMIWQSLDGIQFPAPICWDEGHINDLYLNGTWWSFGDGWIQSIYVAEFGSFMLKAYVADRSGRSTALICAADDMAQHKPVEVGSVLRPKYNDRSFQYYSVYRTDCYNDGPYTEENTVLLASNLTDTTYIDVSWLDAEPGMYKWGVEAHYAGNRSSGIVWNESTMNHLSQEPIAMQEVPVGEIAPSAGLSPYLTYVPDTNLLIKGNRPIGSRATAMQSFGTSDNRFFHWTFPDTESLEFTGITHNTIINSIEKVGDTYYWSGANGDFGIIDVETGERTIISTGNVYHCLAYNPMDEKLYGASLYPGDIYSIDLTTGNATFVRHITSSILTMAINNDGILLFCETDQNSYVYAYNLVTNQWVAAFEGPCDAGYNYAQSMTCDRETNTFYWACYGCAWVGPYVALLVKVDVFTKIYEILGYFAKETYGFCMISEPPSVGGNSVVWSNCLAKGMNLGEDEVSINVLLNSADSPEGTTVSFTNYNENEQTNYPIGDITLDETGYYAWDSFRKGNYQVRVSKDGYQAITDSVGIWEATDLRYVLTEKFGLIDNLYVSHTGWAAWEEPNPEIWLHYDNDFFLVSCGYNAITCYWGIMFPADEMMSYDGFMLPKIALYDYQLGTYTANIYEGGDEAPETLIATQEFQLTGSHNMQEIELETPPTIDGSKNLWITIYYYGWGYPAAACVNTGSPNGRWGSIDGTTWSEFIIMDGFGNSYYYTWMLRGLVTDGRGRSAELGSKENEGERHLENYKVMCTSIEGEPIFNTDTEHNFCQLETDNLVEGETYLCRVAPMYTTGLGIWTETTWVYEPCENYEGTTSGVTVEDEVVSWEYPEESGAKSGAAILGNIAYACNAYGGTLPTGWMSYDLDTPTTGTGINGGLSVFGGDYCPLDQMVYATYNDNSWKKFDPETGVVADQGYLGMFFVDCTWDYSTNTMYGSYDGSLYTWDLDTHTTTFIGDMGVQGMQMIACDLNGQLYGVAFETGNFYRIDKTNGAATLVGATGYGCHYIQSGGFDHNTETLYWAGYDSNGFLATIDIETGQATIIANDTGEQLSWCVPYEGNGPNPNSNILGAMIFRDGEWEAFVPAPQNTYPYGFAGEYCVRIVHDGPMDGTYYSMSCPECVVVECAAGEPISGEYVYNASNNFGALITWAASSHNSIVGYNIYRSTDNSNYTLIGSVGADATEYFDQVEAGDYYYQVRALHDTGCESAPALSADDPTHDYVFIYVTSIDENDGDLKLYPNPTDGKVTIVATGITHIAVVNALGQVLYDADIDGDRCELNLGRYNAGVYMVHITTGNGVFTRRVTVAR